MDEALGELDQGIGKSQAGRHSSHAASRLSGNPPAPKPCGYSLETRAERRKQGKLCLAGKYGRGFVGKVLKLEGRLPVSGMRG